MNITESEIQRALHEISADRAPDDFASRALTLARRNRRHRLVASSVGMLAVAGMIATVAPSWGGATPEQAGAAPTATPGNGCGSYPASTQLTRDKWPAFAATIVDQLPQNHAYRLVDGFLSCKTVPTPGAEPEHVMGPGQADGYATIGVDAADSGDVVQIVISPYRLGDKGAPTCQALTKLANEHNFDINPNPAKYPVTTLFCREGKAPDPVVHASTVDRGAADRSGLRDAYTRVNAFFPNGYRVTLTSLSRHGAPAPDAERLAQAIAAADSSILTTWGGSTVTK